MNLFDIEKEGNKILQSPFLKEIVTHKNPSFVPLQKELMLKPSDIEGYGIHCAKDVPSFTDLGVSHIKAAGTLYRTGLGGFINGSSSPNCILYKDLRDDNLTRLLSINNLKKGEEIVIDYSTAECGMDYCVNVPGSFCEERLRKNTKTEFSGKGIYKIVNKITGKFYIGRSVDMHHRMDTHFAKLRRGVHENKYLQNSWDKYGEDSFCKKIVSYAPENCLVAIEDYILRLLEKDGKGFCYNIRFRGDGIPEPRRRAVVRHSLTGEYIDEFPSTRHVEDATGINRECVRGCCRGNQKTTGGYIFSYKDDVEKVEIVENNVKQFMNNMTSVAHREKVSDDRKGKSSPAKGYKWTDEQLAGHDNKKIGVGKYLDGMLLNMFTSIKDMRRSENMPHRYSNRIKNEDLHYNNFIYKRVDYADLVQELIKNNITLSNLINKTNDKL